MSYFQERLKVWEGYFKPPEIDYETGEYVQKFKDYLMRPLKGELDEKNFKTDCFAYREFQEDDPKEHCDALRESYCGRGLECPFYKQASPDTCYFG